MKKKEDLDVYTAAYEKDSKFTNEHLGMSEVYANRICNQLAGGDPVRILSLGVGHQMVAQVLIENLGERLRKYVIIDGSEEMIMKFRASTSLPAQVEIVHTWFEEYTPDDLFDVIEMGFILEHVDDPDEVLTRYRGFLRAGGNLFMAVPNAKSLHRLIGHRAGLLDDMYRLSEDDLQLGHKRYFDCTAFTQLALRCGLKVVSIEGLFLKPFTTNQLASLNLDAEIWQALYNIGGPFPEISNAVMIEATV